MRPNILEMFETTVSKDVYKHCDDDTDTEWGIQTFIENGRRVLIIYFQASMSKLDWLINLDIRTKEVSYTNVHSGFARKWEDVQGQVLHVIEEWYNINEAPIDVILVGHSQGGATASVGGLSLLMDSYGMIDDLQVITFGCPRYLKEDDGDHEMFMHFQNGNDAVTKIPFKWLGFKDHGHMIPIGKERKWYKYKPSDHLPKPYRKSLNAYFS